MKSRSPADSPDEDRDPVFGPIAGLVMVAEPAVLVALRIGLLVLVPQKLKGHTLFLQILIKVLHRGHRTFFLINTRDGRIKLVF
jgi:hypothetical protein